MDMGMGHLGFNNNVFKRKFRYTFYISHDCDAAAGVDGSGKTIIIPEYYVKVANRPSYTVDTTELNYLNAKKWLPGKVSWETLAMTYIDVAVDEAVAIYNYLLRFYDFNDDVKLFQAPQPKSYEAEGTLQLWDGCGGLLETWIIKGMFPESVNFGDLDYASSDEVTIEVTWRFANVEYVSNCGKVTSGACCDKCGG